MAETAGVRMTDLPGFVDLQVNGFAGVDFSDPALTEAALRSAWRLLLSHGTAAFLPTMITSPPQVYRRNIPLIVAVLSEDEFRGRVLGLHLEGPFISSQPGAVGAHNPDYVREPDPNLLAELLDLGQGHIRLLTVAAEVPGTEALARLAIERGVAVSVGHSLFDEPDLARLAEAGATALTHLGNGLPNLLPRHPNPLWAGLADDSLTAMIIADGHHLPASVVKVVARAKGVDKLVVVSDAAPVAGLPPGEYQVLGNRAVLAPSGRLYNPDKQCLVGSSATMLACMNFLASLRLFDLPDLLAIGFHNPLRLIGVAPDSVPRDAGTRLGYETGTFRIQPGA